MKPISLEMLQKLELAGFQKILLGLESGDEEILKKCHKGITQEDVINAVSLISKTNLKFGIFLIVGLPGETRDTIKATARFIQKLQKIKYFELSETSILTVYPGTEVYEIAKTGGIINDDYWLSDNPAPLYTLEHSEKELIKLKQILLYHVSIQHLLFPAGLIAQFKMLPQIIKFLNKNKYLIPRIISRPLKNYLPDSIFYKIKKIFYFFNNNTNK